MNPTYQLNDIERRQKEIAAEALVIEKQIQTAIKQTQLFLKECSKAGICKVCIQASDDSVPSSKGFPFGTNGSVFAMGDTKNGWPAIWGVCGRTGYSGSCGNADQHSLNKKGQDELIDGAYICKQGKWIKVK